MRWAAQIRRAREPLRRAVVTRRCLPSGMPRVKDCRPLLGPNSLRGAVSQRGCGPARPPARGGAANPWKQAVHANRAVRASRWTANWRTASRQSARAGDREPTDRASRGPRAGDRKPTDRASRGPRADGPLAGQKFLRRSHRREQSVGTLL